MSIHRSHLRRRDRNDAKKTKAANRIPKQKERKRRDARMTAKIKAGDPPYSPVVMSWLGRKLDKRAKNVTTEDVRTLVG